MSASSATSASPASTAGWIEEKLKAGVPFSAGKLGTSELDMLLCFLSKTAYSDRMLKNFFVNAGFWCPENYKTLFIEIWCRKMIQALENIDGIVQWINPLESQLINKYALKANRLVLRDLEPYYTSSWTLALPDDSVLAVISPFSESIKKQIPNLQKIWPPGSKGSSWPPGSSWPQGIWKPQQKFAAIQTFYGPNLDKNGSAGWPENIIKKGPFEAVDYIMNKVLESGATHAIIGCGCISLLIANSLKQKGISAIHTGGATQIFFGIRGGRWDNHSVISKFINEYWVSPLKEEIPTAARDVEGGCYW